MKRINSLADWTFITRHGLALVAIAKNPRSTARQIGDSVGITERAAHKIINDLEKDGFVTKSRVGRQNHYELHPDVPIKDEASDSSVGELLVVLGWKWWKRTPARRGQRPK